MSKFPLRAVTSVSLTFLQVVFSDLPVEIFPLIGVTSVNWKMTGWEERSWDNGQKEAEKGDSVTSLVTWQ